jgi:hypothetical protein
LAGGALAFSAACVESVAHGQVRAEAVEIVYEAPGGCPGRDKFVEEMRARTTRFRVVAKSDATRTVAVEIHADAGGSTGRLLVRESDGREASRSVSAKRCEEVVTALALIAAVAIDPTALSNAPPNPAPPPGPAPAPPPPPASRPPAAPPSEAPPPNAAPPRVAVVSEEAPRTSRFRLAVGAELAAMFATAPEPLIGLRPFIELGSFGHRSVAPYFRLSFMRRGGSQAETEIGGGTFTWTAARLEAGPIRYPPARAFAIQPGVFFDGGAIEATGEDAADAHRETRAWLAPGALLRASWSPLRVLVVEAEGGLAVPLLRYRFFFGPDATLWQVPPLAGTAGIGIGVRFP